MDNGIRRLVLDVLKLRNPPLPDFATNLCSIPEIDTVKVSLVEIDQNTESIKVVIEGSSIDLEYITKLMKDQGAVVHSVDEVVVGKNTMLI